mgnify:FL=1
MKAGLSALLILLAGAAQAVELRLPAGARQMIARDTVQDRFLAPVGVFAEGELPDVVLEGPVLRSAWRIDVADLTPLQLIAPLRRQLEEAGFRIVLDCAAEVCGGYDFRFASEVLPAPNMYVNIRSFNALTALRGPVDAPMQAVNVIASTSDGAAFIQIIQVESGVEEPDVVALPVPGPLVLDNSLPQALIEDGHVILTALDFESGTSELSQGPFSMLETLADMLRAQPDLRIALVGHTDNTGSLEGNIALSVSRAEAVRQRLISQYGIAGARLEARGMGYLAPVTTNATEAGREANRRVEAVVLAE